MPLASVRSAPPTRRGASRIDTERIREQHPIIEVVSRYGVELRRSGASFTGRCPFHADGGRPNLVVFPRSARWWCFRCGTGGDALAFVQQLEHVSFREAASRLGADLRPTGARRCRPRWPARVRAAAAELYANHLLVHDVALAYLVGRGLPRELLERERIGYAAGDELVRYLRWRRLPVEAARRVGLLRADGREYLAGRIVFPEVRAGRVTWLIGRVLDGGSGEPAPAGPRYLGLPGRKPLLGWDAASRDQRQVCLVEGPTDLLTLKQWDIPALALCGTYVAADSLDVLRRWRRLYVVLDDDRAGQEATARLTRSLGDHVIRVELPAGVNDPAGLAARQDGAELFRAALRQALRRTLGRGRAGLEDRPQ